MRIVADEQIWGVPALFEGFGPVTPLPCDAIGPEAVADADVVLIRSVTRVDAALLEGTRVAFVGSATSGANHVDEAWLAANGIAFANTPGCNASTVSDYVLAALLELAERDGFELASKTVGIVGAGRIGSRVGAWARALGMEVLSCDPPLERGGAAGYASFSELASRADIVTVHVPLTEAGEDRTAGMVDGAWLGQLRPGAIFVNTSRGEVVDEAALARHIESGRCGGAVLDVWRNEPAIDRALLDLVDIGGPHIAGYSTDAGRRAGGALQDAIGRWAGRAVRKAKGAEQGRETSIEIRLEPRGPDQKDICRIIRAALDVVSIDERFREAVGSADTASGFSTLRRRCRLRREFGAYTVAASGLDESVRKLLSFMGFRLEA